MHFENNLRFSKEWTETLIGEQNSVKGTSFFMHHSLWWQTIILFSDDRRIRSSENVEKIINHEKFI